MYRDRRTDGHYYTEGVCIGSDVRTHTHTYLQQIIEMHGKETIKSH